MTPKSVPSSVYKAASKPENAFALLLLLDGSVFVEVKAKGTKSLETALKAWKAENLNSLARSDVRFFSVAYGKVTELSLLHRSKR